MQELCRLRSMFPEFVFPSSRLTDEEPEAQEKGRPGGTDLGSIRSSLFGQCTVKIYHMRGAGDLEGLCVRGAHSLVGEMGYESVNK